MIGIFILDEIPKVNKQLVLGHSKINDGISGYFYFRESDCADVCSVDKGDEFFGVLDDTSGFGACLSCNFFPGLSVKNKRSLFSGYVMNHSLSGQKQQTLVDFFSGHLQSGSQHFFLYTHKIGKQAGIEIGRAHV